MKSSKAIVCRLAGAILAVAAVAPAVAQAAPRPARLDTTHDYLPAPASSASRVRSIGPARRVQCADCSDVVEYTSMDGKTYTLTRFPGRYVELLLPDGWIGGTGLSADERAGLIELADLDYQWMKQLIGREPSGDGRTTIAMVTNCGYGCGWVGAKGVEVDPGQGAIDDLREHLAAGSLSNVIVHELNHNFDVFHGQLSYTSDGAHNWTGLMDGFLIVYGRLGAIGLTPEGVLKREVHERFDPYFSNPALNWTACLKNETCADTVGRQPWAGVSLRVASLHGVPAMRRFFAFLLAQQKAGTVIADTPEAREDNHVEALAAAANRDIGCYVTKWRWYASTALLDRMNAQYGSANANCNDVDDDGFSVATGDCDDHDQTRNPGATDIADGIDRDCNGVVDGPTVQEAAAGDFAPELDVAFPSVEQGRITSGDGDAFGFTIGAPQDIEIELCSIADFKGWVFVYEADGGWLDYQYVGLNSCSTHRYTLDQARRWRFQVALNNASAPGTYRVRIHLAPPPVPAAWALAPKAACTANRLRMPVDARAGTAFLQPPDTIRFWVRGAGFVAQMPYAQAASTTWRPPAGIDAGRYAFRAQAWRGSLPVSGLSAPAFFQLGTAGPDTLSGTSGRDVILGLGGNDTIDGLGGNDELCGGAGNDELAGGPGDDVLDGGSGTDVCIGGAGQSTLRACEPWRLASGSSWRPASLPRTREHGVSDRRAPVGWAALARDSEPRHARE